MQRGLPTTYLSIYLSIYRARRQEGGEHEAREVEALLDEVERIEFALALFEGARRDFHHVVAYDESILHFVPRATRLARYSYYYCYYDYYTRL